MSNSLRGKTVLITGANGGLGHALVELFAQNECNIYAHARSENQDFTQFLDRVAREFMTEIRPIYFDLSQEVEIKNGIHPLIRDKVPFDVLVNNAGTMGPDRIFQMTPMAEMHQIFDVNFFGMVYLTQLICRTMMKRKMGSIVNVSSIAGIDCESQIAYSASKAAVIAATKKMAIDLGPYAVRVNAVAPGIIDTSMGDLDSTVIEKALSQTISGRKSTPLEIAKVIAFLACDDSSHINGQVVRVDGGNI